eukprot:SAG22_NODE_321_length_12398_cov_3.218392_16_plen_613_part_00
MVGRPGAAGRCGGCVVILLLMACAPSTPAAAAAPAPTAAVSVATSGQPLHMLDTKFLSFTLDAIELVDRFNGSALGSPVLQKCTAALAPAYLRIGGSTEDYLRYGPGPLARNMTAAVNVSTTWQRVNRFASDAGLDIIFGLNSYTSRAAPSAPWDPALSGAVELINFTLSRPWSEFPVAGWELGNEMDIKVRGGQTTVPPAQLARDVATLRALVDRLTAREAGRRPKQLLFGPDTATLGGIGNPARVYRNYFRWFAGNLSALAAGDGGRAGSGGGGGGGGRAGSGGNGSGGGGGGGGGDVVSELTFHQYYFRGPGAKASQFMSSSTLDSLKTQIDFAVGVQHGAASSVTSGVSLGETASSFSGGTPGLSDSFASTFGWVDKLGLSAARGLRRVFRQDLSGFEPYSLFQLEQAAAAAAGGGEQRQLVEVPTPDYFATLLWKRLMGTTVLHTTYDADGADGAGRSGDAPPARSLRAYPHCAAKAATAQRPGSGRRTMATAVPGDIAIALINLQNSTATFDISTAGAASAVSLSALTSLTGRDYTGRAVLLNGRKLEVKPDGSPPDLLPVRTARLRSAEEAEPATATGAAVAVPPYSVSFAVLHGTRPRTCLAHE